MGQTARSKQERIATLESSAVLGAYIDPLPITIGASNARDRAESFTSRQEEISDAAASPGEDGMIMDMNHSIVARLETHREAVDQVHQVPSSSAQPHGELGEESDHKVRG